MAKVKSVFVCQQCGSQRPRWQGRCDDCGAWNSFVEELQQPATPSAKGGRGWSVAPTAATATRQVVTLGQSRPATHAVRVSTGFNELDRVMGGGIVRGSYILLGGDPGVGKSTLLLQMAGGLAGNDLRVLYISGEESVDQTSLRATRLGIKSENVQIASESLLETILNLAETEKPDVLVVDSIQTIYLSEITAAPGSVSQVRECAARLMSLAKSRNITVFLIGHVTKEGTIAGPKVLEHMVDTVLSFEGDPNHQFRLLRALKNRFGATNELGVFQMNSIGLEEVANPSEFFLEERGRELIGSAVFAAMEGTRPLLCEVQALATYSPLAMPRRTSIGFDLNRVHLLVAVLDKQLELGLAKQDVFVNVVGGLKLAEPAADLAVAAALVSSSENNEIYAHTCFFGEIGLTGEIRAASFAEERLREGLKLGFKKFVLPESNRKHIKNVSTPQDCRLVYIKQISDLAKILAPEVKTRSTEKKRPGELNA